MFISSRLETLEQRLTFKKKSKDQMGKSQEVSPIKFKSDQKITK